MTTYDIIAQNQRKTYLLISFFLIFIIALGWFFSYLLQANWLLIAAVIFSSLMSIISYWHSDKIVLALNRAKEIKKDDYPQIYRTVENLCLAAGLPMPKIYLIEDSSANAFATGRDPKHSAIALTTGLIKLLDKAELEGVIGHELSHIKHRDTLISTVIVILVGIVALISDWFLRISFWFGRRRDENSGGNVLFFLLGVLAAFLAPIVATLIQLAISRKREFLADAGSAMLTRYPQGLIRALEKISQQKIPLKHASTATAHLYIVNPFKGKQAKNWLKKLFLTHPPIEERIKALAKMSF